MVGAVLKLSSQVFAVLNKSVKNIHFWRDATSSSEAAKNRCDSYLLIFFKTFDFHKDTSSLVEMVTETTDNLGWYEKLLINYWWWSNVINEDIDDWWWLSNE